VLVSATLMSAPDIARLMRTDKSHVRKVIHAFNEEGFGSLDPDCRGGRPRRRRRASATGSRCARARPPDTQGVPLTRWSLSKLAPHLGTIGVELSRGGRCARC
jgi:transposase